MHTRVHTSAPAVIHGVRPHICILHRTQAALSAMGGGRGMMILFVCVLIPEKFNNLNL